MNKAGWLLQDFEGLFQGLRKPCGGPFEVSRLRLLVADSTK